MEGTRAPWAKSSSNTTHADTTLHSGIGSIHAHTASATPSAAAVAAPHSDVHHTSSSISTRAPWAHGVSIGSVGTNQINFDTVKNQYPEYVHSIQSISKQRNNDDGSINDTSNTKSTSSPSSISGSSVSSHSSLKYFSPSKLIRLPSYMSLWPETCAYAELISFIMLLNEQIKGIPCENKESNNNNNNDIPITMTDDISLSDDDTNSVSISSIPSMTYEISPRIQLLVNWLNASRNAISNIPPIKQSMRFGNKAFRIWYAQCIYNPQEDTNSNTNTNTDINSNSQPSPSTTSSSSSTPSDLIHTLSELIGPSNVSLGILNELLPYAYDSFGSFQRIDYGTGHELNFILLLCALNKLGIFGINDLVPLVSEVFSSYMKLMQSLQSTYWLEPAGSKGAWGLDDYSFLPFLWGSAQLKRNSYNILPKDILLKDRVHTYASKYIFLNAIQFIHKMKTGPFDEHSAYLSQIAQCANWDKVNSGLIRMYQVEVLSKFPIIQHVSGTYTYTCTYVYTYILPLTLCFLHSSAHLSLSISHACFCFIHKLIPYHSSVCFHFYFSFVTLGIIWSFIEIFKISS
jgi:hypothetical protein